MPRKLLQRLQGRSTGSHCRLLHTIVSLVRGCHCRHPGSEIRVCQETFAPRLRWSSDHQVRPKFEFLRKPSVVSRGIIKLSCTRLHTIGPPGTCAVGVLAGIQSWWAWCVRTVRVYTSLQGDCHSRIANSHDGCRQQASAGYDAAALGAVFDMPAARLLAVGGGRRAAWELFGGVILMLWCAHVCLLCLCLVWRCVSSVRCIAGVSHHADTPFYQQRLKAWQPILTPKWVVATFLVVGVIFIPTGFILKGASDSVRRPPGGNSVTRLPLVSHTDGWACVRGAGCRADVTV